MKSAILLVVLAVFAIQSTADYVNDPIVHQKLNKAQSAWTAGENEFFNGKTVEYAKGLLGWKPTGKKLPTVASVTNVALPTNYSAATAFPQCETVGTIYNQAECGSCWAFGCVEAVSDRFCIQSAGKVNVLLSFEDLVSCGPDNGCEGGDAGDAWSYVSESGLPTNSCYPYSIPTCPPQDQPCLNFVNTPQCNQQCVDGESFQTSLHFLTEAHAVNSDQTSIMNEIYNYGPVEACFSVYQDFLSYKSGVYQYQTGDYLGGHCIKIIGWGVENGLPYWLCNNSWTTYWGDNGQFKILRGQDMCGIEDDVVAGTPNLSSI